MRADYKRALIGREFPDLYSLQMAGQEIDATNTYLFTKPQGNAQTNAIQATGKPAPFNTASREHGQGSQRGGNKGSNQQQASTQQFRPKQGANPGKPGGKPFLKKDQTNPKTEDKAKRDSRPEKGDSSEGEAPESQKGNNGLEGQLRKHVPLNEKFVCFNCRSQQHFTGQCTQPYKVHCQVCGFLGFPTHRCPFCSKNSQRRKDRSPSK